MTVEEAARTLGLSPQGIRKRIATGAIRAERVGMRLWLIPNEEVERHRQMGRQRPGPKARQKA